MEQSSNRQSSFDFGQYYSIKRYKKHFGHLNKTADFKRVLIECHKQMEETQDQLPKHRNGALWIRQILTDFKQKKQSRSDRFFNFVLRRDQVKEPKKYENTLKELNSKYFDREYLQGIINKGVSIDRPVAIDEAKVVSEISRLQETATHRKPIKHIQQERKPDQRNQQPPKNPISTWKKKESEKELVYADLDLPVNPIGKKPTYSVTVNSTSDEIPYAVIQHTVAQAFSELNKDTVEVNIKVSRENNQQIHERKELVIEQQENPPKLPPKKHRRNPSVHGEVPFTGHHDNPIMPRRLSTISEVSHDSAVSQISAGNGSLKKAFERRNSILQELRSAPQQVASTSTSMAKEQTSNSKRSVMQRVWEIENGSGAPKGTFTHQDHGTSKRPLNLTMQEAVRKSGNNRPPEVPSRSLKPKYNSQQRA
ncbi:MULTISPECIES: hypothetical protein [unclassified Enterococcus]|uniref:hypothetical protein n=1 Tax=unclassified Enterococcus TaxID=2608891 RepID=UPI001A9B6148|nr:hypothetical protein [Enterococcus sp. DIV1271a]MBO1298744.1 hypothetical protein [Enterococcus sp. DIV1271a]